MKKLGLLTIFFLVFNLTTAALNPHAQEIDLVKLKKEEEERRKKLEKQKKKKTVVITNETLKQYGERKKTSDSTKKPDVKSNPDASQKPEKVDPMQTKEYWQNLKKNLEKQIRELTQQIEIDQLELNRLSTEYLINDLPLEKQAIKERKDELARLLESQKKRLKGLQAEYDSLPEKARKAGIPPGWLR